MTSVLRELPLSYAVLSEARAEGSAGAIDEKYGDRLICVRFATMRSGRSGSKP